MEDLLGFLIVIVGIVASIKNNQKKKQQAQGSKAARQAAAKPQTKAPYSQEALQAWFEEETADKPAKADEPAVAASTGSISEQTHEGLHPCDEHSSAPRPVAQPRIQARVQVTEKPQVVMGSMGTDTHEGIHPCEEHEGDLLPNDKPLIAMPVEKPGLQLEWTGENMVKAFVMQEILTRPSQRRRA